MSVYDFSTVIKRPDSKKWAMMREINPAVGEDTIPLSVADMEFVLAPEISRGLQKYLEQAVLGYNTPTDAYYRAVCSWMDKRHSFPIEKDWITVISGIVPALYQAVQSFTEIGDGVVVMSPVYFPFYSAIEQSGRRVVNCPLIFKNNRYLMDLKLLSELTAGENNKLLLFCSPHNPVGRVWERSELEELSEICTKNNLIVISDEIHHDIVAPGHEHIVFQTLSPELAERVITCTAPSKSFNLGGQPISNLIIKNKELKDKFDQNLNNTGFRGSTILSHVACELAYNQCAGWLDEALEIIDGNDKFCRDFLARHCPKIKVMPREGTYLLWADFSCFKLDDAELCHFLQQEAEFFVNPGAIFGEGGSGFVRINLALPQKALEQQMLKLLQALSNKGLV